MTATSKLFDFLSDTAVHTAGERSIKTENHGVSRDFQRFPDSSAIELDVFNDESSNSAYCAAVVLCAMQFI